jgi:hypothetical protein
MNPKMGEIRRLVVERARQREGVRFRVDRRGFEQGGLPRSAGKLK